MIWMHESPTSTLFTDATLASFSIAFFSQQWLKVVNPRRAGRLAVATFLLSILLFASIGYLSRSEVLADTALQAPLGPGRDRT